MFIISPQGIIRLFFGDDFVAVAPILILLTAGLSLVTLMAIINTIMIAHNKMKDCFIMIAVLITVDLICALILVPKYGLMGAALATCLAGLLGTIWGGFHIFEEFKALVFSLSMVRIASITLLLYFLFSSFNLVSINVIIKSIFITVLYFLFLLLTKELSSIDIRRLKDAVKIT